MVQNSLGRHWIETLQAKGDSRTAAEIAEYYNWHYFMPAAEQNAQISLTIETSAAKLADASIDTITLVDPAMGSGHILVYAFEVFMQMYISEGYSQRDAAKLIVQKNLFGFDIDTRAFQLAYFALMMKARQYNRRFLNNNIQPNTFDILESSDIKIDDFNSLIKTTEEQQDLNDLLSNFKYGNDYGSLIHFDHQLNWENLKQLTQPESKIGQLSFADVTLAKEQKKLSQVIKVAELLSRTYTIGVMNPPYMGSGKMNSVLSNYVKKSYPDSKSDLFSVFMERLQSITADGGYVAMITQHAWMFLSSFEKLRKKLRADTLINMAHLGTRAFEEIGGEVVQSTTFILKNQQLNNYIGTYERLVDFNSQSAKEQAYLSAVKDMSVSYLYRTNQANFEKIPGSPIAYWANDNVVKIFGQQTLDMHFSGKEGLGTSDNKKFLRYWYELRSNSNLTGWFPYQKGGSYRKWFGNNDYYVNWKDNGSEMKSASKSNIRNLSYQNHIGITWSAISSGKPSFRYTITPYFFDSKGPMMFHINDESYLYALAYLNSKVSEFFLSFLSPTLDYRLGQIQKLPYLFAKNPKAIQRLAEKCVNFSVTDWNYFERSSDFHIHPLLMHIADDKLLIWYYSLVQTNISAKNVPIFQLWGLK